MLGRASSHCAGFTMVEMLTVMVLIGIMAAMVTKPVSSAFRASARRTAKREASAYLFRARTIAVQQSRASQLVRNGNILKIPPSHSTRADSCSPRRPRSSSSPATRRPIRSA